MRGFRYERSRAQEVGMLMVMEPCEQKRCVWMVWGSRSLPYTTHLARVLEGISQDHMYHLAQKDERHTRRRLNQFCRCVSDRACPKPSSAV